jgi:hypothetical protein
VPIGLESLNGLEGLALYERQLFKTGKPVKPRITNK